MKLIFSYLSHTRQRNGINLRSQAGYRVRSGGPMVAQTHIPFTEEKKMIVFGSWLLHYDIVG